MAIKCEYGQRRMKGKLWLLVVLLSIFYWVYTLPTICNQLGNFGGDNCQYIILAEALAQGDGLRLVNYPQVPFSKYPPLLSLILVPIVKFWGRQFALMHLLIALLGYFSLIFFYKTFRLLDSSEAVASFSVLLLFVSWVFWIYLHRILTEIPFLFFSALSFYYLLRYVSEKKVFSFRAWVLCLALNAAYFTRYMGFLLFVFSLIFIWNISQDRKLCLKKVTFLTFSFGIPVLLWQLRNYLLPTYPLFFKEQFWGGNLLKRWVLGANFYTYILAGNLFPYSLGSRFTAELARYLVLGLVILGIWRTKQTRLLGFYSLCYLFLIALWPYREDGRYLLGMLPLAIFHFLCGLYRLPFMRRSLFIFCCLLLFGGNLLFLPPRPYASRGISGPVNDFLATLDWVRDNLPEEALVFSRKPRLTYFLTGHPSLGYVGSRGPLWGYFKRNNIRYIIYDGFTWESREILEPLIQRYHHKLRLLFRKGNCRVYEIREF